MGRIAITHGAGIAAPPGPFSRAVWAGDLLYVSGQTGTDPANGRLVEGGVVEETRQVMANLAAVLHAAGLGTDDVVKANVYLVSMDAYAAVNAAYALFFDEPHHGRGRGPAGRRSRRDRAHRLPAIPLTARGVLAASSLPFLTVGIDPNQGNTLGR